MRKVLVVALLAAGVAVGQPPAKRPGGLDVVPADGFAFVSVNVAKVWDEPALKGLKEALQKAEGSPLKNVEERLGLPAGEIDRVTFLWPSTAAWVPPLGLVFGESPFVIVAARKPYNEAKLLKALAADVVPFQQNLRALGDAMRRFDGKPFALPPGYPGAANSNWAEHLLPHIEKDHLYREWLDKKPPSTGKGDKIKIDTAPSDPPPLPETAPPPKKQEPKEPQAELTKFTPGDGGDPERAVPDVFYPAGMNSALFLLDDATFVFIPRRNGEFDPVLGLLKLTLRKKATGALSEALALADKHAVVAGLDFRPVREGIARDPEMPRAVVPFRSLFKVSRVTATLDVGATTTATARLTFANEADAKRAEPVLQTLLQLGTETLAAEKKRAAADPDRSEVVGPIFELLAGSLDKAEVKLDGTTVVATASADIGPAVQKAVAALPAYAKTQSDQTATLNNLKMIGLALHNFSDVTNALPHDIVDQQGKPLLSWRVQLLPYLEQDNLYRQLDLTKAWDDPANAKLLAKMPKVFQVPGRAGKDGETYFQMFSAEKPVPGGSPLLMAGQKRRFADIQDGLSNTFGVVEAAAGVNWAKPGDLPFDPKKLPALGDPKTGQFRVMMLDGSVRTVRRDKISDAQLRAFITVNGAEINTHDDR